MWQRFRESTVVILGVVLCIFTLIEVNYPRLQQQSALAIFVMCGLVICFLDYPLHPRLAASRIARSIDLLLIAGIVFACGYVVVQSEPWFQAYWYEGASLGNRAGIETRMDFAVGLIGLLLVLEATRRSIGWIVPVLSLLFIAHSYYNFGSVQYGWPQLPTWALPHSGQPIRDITSVTFLQSLGVFGPAASVMFTYVFLFVIFGAFLEMTGATQFIIDFSQRLFGRSSGGPAKVSVLSSCLMGSLSGSAVANAVTTGAFTIPLMKRSGFKSHVAAAVEAAAGSGGALVPPVMGAGAYMMLELVSPPVTFNQIIKAAIIPSVLYYLSLFLIVHFYAARLGSQKDTVVEAPEIRPLSAFEGVSFFGSLATLIILLINRFSPFKAVTTSIAVILLINLFRPQKSVRQSWRWAGVIVFVAVSVAYGYYQVNYGDLLVDDISFREMVGLTIDAMACGMMVGLFPLALFQFRWRSDYSGAMTKSARNGVSLIAASACVGIIIGIVQQTGIASDFSDRIKDVVESSLFLALVGIMVCSLILGMGVPSVVCYLLMATLMGPMLSELGVIPLAAHLFIFYFGMMSMVTPPVALAAYAAASIANAKVMPTAWAAFRFALAGFTLPYMFVYRPALLLMPPPGGTLHWYNIVVAIVASVLGITALASGIAGYFVTRLRLPGRLLMFASAALLLSPNVGGRLIGFYINLVGLAVMAAAITVNFRTRRRERAEAGGQG